MKPSQISFGIGTGLGFACAFYPSFFLLGGAIFFLIAGLIDQHYGS